MNERNAIILDGVWHVVRHSDSPIACSNCSLRNYCRFVCPATLFTSDPFAYFVNVDSYILVSYLS